MVEALELVLHLQRGQTPALARECLARMRPAEFHLLREFAADVLALGEELGTGQQTLVLQVSDREARALLGNHDFGPGERVAGGK